MAGNTIDIKLKVHSNTEEETARLKKLSKEKEKLEGKEYGVARSAVGTGAAGRDFAKQAEGLGGFVRVYATFAANAFAAQAAFTALSNAMDTTNMVKGMDQLGAASGMALGSLAKRLADTTDGAVSMREAMEATTKATAAGMTSKQLLLMGEVAKKASQALGISMPDALSRLSRGITKLEPELLDELGIFTKIEPSVNDYARALGKSATSLTDFERRQAFTIAVLTEGINKFGNIDIPSNPYDKLLASIKNISQEGLSLINTVLGPVARLLSESPTALAGALTALVGILVKKALPAVTQFRESLQSASRESAGKAYARLEETKESRSELAIRANRAAIKAAQYAAEEVANIKLQVVDTFAEKIKAMPKKPPKFIREMASIQDAADLTPEMIDMWKKQLPSVAKSASLTALATEGIKANEQWLKAELDVRKAVTEETDKYIKLQEKSWGFKRDAILAERALQGYIRDTIAIEAEQVGRRQGFGEAWRQTKEEVKRRRAGPTEIEIPTGRTVLDPTTGKKVEETVTAIAGKMSRLGAMTTYARVAFIGLSNAISGILAVAAPFVEIVLLLAPALGFLHDKLLDNAEATERTKKSYEAFTESVRAANNTVEYLGKNSEKILSISNINAAGTAFIELGNNFSSFVKNASKELENNNWYASLVERIKKAFGGGTEVAVQEATAKAVETALKIAGPGADKLRETLAGIMGLSPDVSIERLIRALKDIPLEKSKELSDALLKAGTNAKAASQSIVDLNNNLKESVKTFDTLINGLLPSSGIAKWALDGFKNMQEFNKAIGKNASDIGALNDMLADPENIVKKFGPQAFESIAPLLDPVKSLNKEYTQVLNNLSELDKKEFSGLKKNIAYFEEQLAGAQKRNEAGSITKYTQSLEKQKQALEVAMSQSGKRQDLLIQRDKIEQDIKGIFKEFNRISAESAAYFANTLASEIEAGYARGALAVRRAASSYIQDPEARAEEVASIAKKDIAIQMDQIKQSMNLVRALELSRISIDENTLIQKARSVQESGQLKEGAVGKLSAKQESDLMDEVKIGLVSAGQRRKLMTDQASGRQKQSIAEIQQQAGAGNQNELDRLAAQATLTSTTMVALQQLSSGQAKLGELGGQAAAADLVKQLDTIKATNEKLIQQKQYQVDVLQARKQGTSITLEALGSEAEKVQAIAVYDKEILKINNDIKEAQLQNNIVIADRLKLQYPESETYRKNAKYAEEQLARFQALRPVLENNALVEADRKEKLAEISDKYRIIGFDIARQNTLMQAGRQLEDAQINAEKSRFDTLAGMGRYTEQEIQDKNTIFAISQAELEQRRQIQDIQKKISDAQVAYQRALESGNVLEIQRTENVWLDELAAADLSTEAVKRNTQAKIENARLTNSMSVEQKKFADFATRSFESMGDAIADFAMTGKLNFKSLIDSMISDFIRMVMRMNMQKLAGGAGGQDGLANLFGKLIGSFFTPTVPVGGAPGGGSLYAIDQIPVQQAKGGIWDSGVQKFAKGGMFTNSIVHSPTLFKFAKGTGLMGEAGPEAIMPLTRDGSGRLGVQAQGAQSNVDIVVNNYSGQQATTKETKDSRGNRRIEVVVGDMNATEMSRPGSSSQQALRSNFGLQPALVRR